MAKRELQKLIIKILVESKRNEIPYLTRPDISEKLKQVKPNLEHADRKTSQALYLLSIKKSKWNKPDVIKEGKGWTVKNWTK